MPEFLVLNDLRMYLNMEILLMIGSFKMVVFLLV